MWFGQTGLNINRFETGLSASVNGARENNEQVLQIKSRQNSCIQSISHVILRPDLTCIYYKRIANGLPIHLPADQPLANLSRILSLFWYHHG